MKKIECTLTVNTRLGYYFPPMQCSSISEAVRRGKEYPGFYYRVFWKDPETGNIKSKGGYCDD